MRWWRVTWPPIEAAVRAPAAWVFAAVWIGAIGVLVARGYGNRAAGAPIVLVPTLVWMWMTIMITEPPPAEPPSRPSNPRLAVQTAAVVVIATLIALSAMSFYGVGPAAFRSIPVWSGLFSWLVGLAGALPFPAPAAISNPVLELLLPLLVLLVLGATLGELGFRRGHRSWLVLLLWSVPQLVVLVIAVVGHQATLPRLLAAFIRNGFQNGPVEEFLFRGALQTRLSLWLGRGWGLVLASLAFGAFHIGSNAAGETHRDLLSGFCLGLVNQAPYGLAFGLIFQRTRNLLAGSILHMLIDLP